MKKARTKEQPLSLEIVIDDEAGVFAESPPRPLRINEGDTMNLSIHASPLILKGAKSLRITIRLES